jgi:sulfate-transporting ATPase
MGADVTSVLRVEDVTVEFGSLVALRGVSVDVTQGRTVGLIGPNGAGKSTLLNVIAGVTRPRHGRISYGERDITTWSTATRARAGLRRTFQHLELFEDMTVFENIVVAAETASSPLVSKRQTPHRGSVFELLGSLGIADQAHAQTRTLAHPVKRLVSYARAVVSSPQCLLLDEPVAGLAEGERHAFAEQMREDIKRRGLTVVLVEHDMRFIEGLCDEVYVLNAGQIIAHGSFADIAKSPDVRAAYLGGVIDE